MRFVAAALLLLLAQESKSDSYGDPLPDGATARMGTVRLRHAAASLAFSPDGKTLASGGYDTFIRLWEVATSKPLKRLDGHASPVTALLYSPDGTTLFSGDDKGGLRAWDVATGKQKWTKSGHTAKVACLACSADGKAIASASHDKSARIWAAADGAEIVRLEGHEHTVNGVAFSPDGKLVASASFDKTVRIWDAATGKSQQVCTADQWLECVSFTPDGKSVAAAGFDPSIRFFDVATGAATKSLKKHGAMVRRLVFPGDGSRLIAPCEDNTVEVWDTKEAKLSLKGKAGIAFLRTYAAAVTVDGKRVAFATQGIRVRIWEIDSWEELNGGVKGHTHRVTGAAVSPDGKTVASGSWDNKIILWETATGKEIRMLRGSLGPVQSVAFSSDGKTIASGSGEPNMKFDTTVRLWDPSGGAQLRALKGHEGDVLAVAFSRDGAWLASGDALGVIRVWKTATWKEARSIPGAAKMQVNRLVFGDGATLVASGSDGNVRVLDAESGEEKRSFKGRAPEVTRDGSTVAFVVDATVHVAELATGKEIVALPGGGVAAFSPDGRRIAVTTKEGGIKINGLPSGTEMRAIPATGAGVVALVYAPDGETIVSVNGDTTLLVWRADEKK